MWFGLFNKSPRPTPPPAAPVAPAPHERADALLRRLDWTVLRRLDGLLQGDFRSLMRGSGLDLADLREYQHLDDVRHIDWNVTARLQTPHLRVFTEDREMAAWFLLDLSPSLDFGSGPQRKSTLLRETVAVLARLMTRHGNRVGALRYGAHGEPTVDAVLPARSGTTHVLRLLHLMEPVSAPTPPSAPKGHHAPPRHGTRLADLLGAAARTLRQRATVFVLSDFISEPGWEPLLGALARRHDVVAVRLLDPLEQALPDWGLLPLCDAETGEQLLVDTHDAGFRQRFARLSAQREAQLRASLAQAGVDTLELATGDDLSEALLRLVALRQHRLRHRGPQRPTGPHPAPVGAPEGVRP